MDYIDIRVIADRLKRHPLLEDVPFETIIDYAVEFIKIIGAPASFIEKTGEIEVKNYRGVFPCDFYSLIQVRDVKGNYYRGSTDSFHMSPNKEKNGNKKRDTGFTYKVQGNCIITSIEECTLEIAYRAFPMTEEGFPLIPDNGSYSRALELYIKKELFTMLFDQGKISPQVLQNTQQQYAWAVGQAQTDLIRPSLDQMESISNMWNRFLVGNREHNNGFVSEGSIEHFKIH